MLPKLSSEFLGTFWLVLGGCGSALLTAGGFYRLFWDGVPEPDIAGR
jgi:hypothetical protein